MKYFKKENKINLKPILILAFFIIISFFLFKKTFYRSLVTINLGSLNVDLINLSADFKNLYENNDVDKISLTVSPNNFVKLQKERSKMTSNYILTGNQWSSENSYYKSKVKLNSGQSKAEIKLFGMNPDHFRDSDGHSFRVKYDGKIGFGNKKVNFINPRSRDYITDALSNIIFFEISKGVKINYELFKVIFNKRDYGYYLKEDFFDKYLLEENKRRESLIFEVMNDSIHFNHVGDENEFLSLSNEIYTAFESDYDAFLELFDIEKLKGILLILLIINDRHPVLDINMHWIHNPVTGLIEPTIREGFVYESKKVDLDNLIFPGLINDLYVKYIEKDFPYFIKEKLPIIKSILIKNPDYLKFKKNMVGFESKIASREKIISNNISLISNVVKDLSHKGQDKKDSLIFIKRDTLILNNWTIKSNETLVINPGVQITLNNVYLKILGGLSVLGKKNDRVTITCPISNPSTIFIQTPKIIEINNTDFSNLTNLKSPFQQPASIIFYETNNVLINNSTFTNNVSGDDFLNFFRSEKVKIKNSKIFKTYSDAIDSDFSQITIQNSTFENIGNDAIDGSGSDIVLDNNIFLSSKDKAVSAGERSSFLISNCFFENNEIGIVSKDNSMVVSRDNILVNNRLDLAVFKKKKIYKHPSLFLENTKVENYLIEKKAKIRGLENIKHTTNVEDKLYGKLYGKSSDK